MRPRLLLITDLSIRGPRETVARLVALAAHPRRGDLRVGVRGPGRPARELLAVAQGARAAGLSVAVHDRLDVALVAGVGVQLGERSVRPDEARAVLPPRTWIGRSCHDEAGLREAVEAPVDAITVSPFSASPGKGRPLGAAGLGALVECARTAGPEVQVFALGGIDVHNAGEAVRSGADGVAVVRAWLEPADVEGAVDALLAAIASARPPRVGAWGT